MINYNLIKIRKEFYKKLRESSLNDWRRWIYNYERGWRPPEECLWSFEYIMNKKNFEIQQEDYKYYKRAKYLLEYGIEYIPISNIIPKPLF
jgi:hypothetical protein